MPPLHCEVHALGKTNRYRMRAIITRSLFETASDYLPRILGPKIAEFPCLVHKLSLILTTLQYKTGINRSE